MCLAVVQFKAGKQIFTQIFLLKPIRELKSKNLFLLDATFTLEKKKKQRFEVGISLNLVKVSILRVSFKFS